MRIRDKLLNLDDLMTCNEMDKFGDSLVLLL